VAPVALLGGREIGGKVSKICFTFSHGRDSVPFGFLYTVGYGLMSMTPYGKINKTTL
jgi:hypothetical protein